MKAAINTAAKNVDDYLESLPEAQRKILEELRNTIKSAAPQTEEVISYQIPTYKYKGALVHFAAFKDHCSFYVIDKSILETFAKDLEPFKTSGTTIHFTPDHPLPTALVKKIVKKRMKDKEG